MAYAFVGVPITCLLLASIVDRLERMLTGSRTSLQEFLRAQSQRHRHQQRRKNTSTTNNNNNRYTRSNYRTIPRPHSPPPLSSNRSINLYVRALLVGVFLVAFVYAAPAYVLTDYTEFDWSYLDSVYYTYISITTIGFGDLVPGEDQPSDYRDIYRIIVTGYSENFYKISLFYFVFI